MLMFYIGRDREKTETYWVEDGSFYAYRSGQYERIRFSDMPRRVKKKIRFIRALTSTSQTKVFD